MANLERLILMAEDELTEYSTDTRKIEKLRRKIALSLPATEQRQIKETLIAEMLAGGFGQILAEQRQTVILPW
jgi:hypothetical protein